MKFVITMAGEGSRFKQAGIDEEKYRLQVRDRTMFEYAMESLRTFFGEEFVFVVRADHEAVPFVREKCVALGIDGYEIVEIKQLTSGQATTAHRASPYVNEENSVTIYNIDTFVEPSELSLDALNGDGCIPVFETDEGSWSFVAVDDEGFATGVAEKRPISNLASLGLYHFDRWEWFESAFEATGESVEAKYGERYIAPLYNWLIEQGLNVTVQRVPRSAVHVLGTPDDVSSFDPGFVDRYDLND